MSHFKFSKNELALPFIKWKILSTETYKLVAKSPYTDRYLRKLFQEMSDKKLLESLSFYQSRKKYYFLTKKFLGLLNLNPDFRLSGDQIYHQEQISRIASSIFLNFRTTSLSMQHELINNPHIYGSKYLPDFHFSSELKKKNLNFCYNFYNSELRDLKFKKKYSALLKNKKLDHIICHQFTPLNEHYYPLLFKKYLKGNEKKLILIKSPDPKNDDEWIEKIELIQPSSFKLKTIKKLFTR